MPRKTDTMPLNSKFLKRNVKLLDCQRERIFKMHHSENYGINQLARMFKVNKRLIQFICYPERHERNLQLRQARGGSVKYYNRDKHTKATKEHRNHKKEVFSHVKTNTQRTPQI
jgi:hypothetical protein